MSASGAALDMRGTPGLFPRRREDDRGVSDVLHDSRRGWTCWNRLQRKQIAVDDADRVQRRIQAERRPADRGRGQSRRTRRADPSALVHGRRDALDRGQDFAQREFGRQRHVGHSTAAVACGQHGDPNDRHHSESGAGWVIV